MFFEVFFRVCVFSFHGTAKLQHHILGWGGERPEAAMKLNIVKLNLKLIHATVLEH